MSCAAFAHCISASAQDGTSAASANADRSARCDVLRPAKFAYAYSMTAVCARVAGAFGRNVPSPQPTTMPFSAAQMTASVYHRSAGTSVKGFSAVTAGSPAKR